MIESQYLNLDPIEATIASAATQIYAAYISAGRVTEGSESLWMTRAVEEAVEIANLTDERVLAKGEMG
jgi:threonine/homoserine efflux transporter RhtA